MRKLISSLLIVFVFIWIVGCSSNAVSVEEDPPTPVIAEKAKEGAQESKIKLVGTAEAKADVMLVPEVSGKLIKVLVDEGAWMDQGTAIAQLESDLYEEQVNQASSALRSAQEAINLNVSQAKAAVEQAQQQAASAREQVADLRNRYELGEGVTQTDMRNAEDNLRVAELQLEQAQSSLSSAYSSSQAQVAQAQAALAKAKQDLENTTLKAPISGEIVTITPGIGDLVSPQSPFARIVDATMIYISYTLTEQQLGLVQEGQELAIDIRTLNNSYTGTVTLVSPASNPQTKTYITKVAINNADGAIKPGMMAEMTLESPTRLEGIIVPTEAVMEEDGTYYVYVVKNAAASRREVKVIDSNSTVTVISEGLAEGELVVTRGQYQINDQSPVRVLQEGGE